MPTAPTKTSRALYPRRAIARSLCTQHFNCSTRLALAALLAATPAFANTPDSYSGPDLGLWSNPLNWSAGTPNNSTFDVTINSSSPITVQLDANETINTLMVSPLDALRI